METLGLLETADESSENSGIVKSEDESPTVGSGRSSPPPNCAICLGRCRNKSFTDSCLHQFCFKCLVTWSRVKTECPLCKQVFKSIIHNVKSNHQYEEYRVQQPQNEDRGPAVDYGAIYNAAGRFRYRTTLTLPRRETMAIRQFLLHYPLTALMSELPGRTTPRERTRRSPADFRRTVYRHNLWARPLPDFTGRFRDCSPDFFRYNESQVHRLIVWLSRELTYLLPERSLDMSLVLSRILQLLPEHHITSERFRAELRPYLGAHTDHFLHEFYCYAATPYDITGYDRHVQYRTVPPAGVGATVGPGLVSEVLSSSDTDSHDSDIMMVSSSHEAGPSRVPASSAPTPAPVYPQPAVIPIETISHSDSDADSEVMVVGYLKPPHQRTPELVDLLASDSDVVVQEPEEPPPAPAAPPPDQLVRFKLAITPRPRAPDSSDSSADERRTLYTPPLPVHAARRRRRARTSDSRDDTYTPSPAEYSSTDEYDSGDETSSSNSEVRRKRTTRRRPKKKRTRGSRSRGRAERVPRRARDDAETVTGDKKLKGKSKNGKNVKSSRVDLSDIPLPPEVDRPRSNDGHKKKRKAKTAPDRVGLSGLGDVSRRKRSTDLVPLAEQAGPSGLANGSKRKKSEDAAPALDSTGPSGVRKGSKRKRHVEPAALERPGPSKVDDELETKRTEPTSAFDRLGANGLVDGHKKTEKSPTHDAAGPSGINDWWRRSEDRTSPVLGDGFNKKKKGEHVSRQSSRDTHENKRLKSVVKVIQRDVSESSGNGSVKREHYSDASASGRPPHRSDNFEVVSPKQTHTDRGYSSSDDNIPLHLTVSNPYTVSRTHVSDYSD